jgi:hypothetical protein
MSGLVTELIDVGLKYEEQGIKRAINAPLFKRPSNIEYVVTSSNKTYISVPKDVYTKVKAYAKKKNLKLIEATWTLISVGFQYYLSGDPKSGNNIVAFTRLFGDLAKELRRARLPVSEDYLADPEMWVIDLLDRALSSKPTRRLRQTQGIPNLVLARISRQRETYLKYLNVAMKRIEALEKENTEMKKKLAQQNPVEVRGDINKKHDGGFPKLG